MISKNGNKKFIKICKWWVMFKETRKHTLWNVLQAFTQSSTKIHLKHAHKQIYTRQYLQRSSLSPWSWCDCFY